MVDPLMPSGILTTAFRIFDFQCISSNGRYSREDMREFTLTLTHRVFKMSSFCYAIAYVYTLYFAIVPF